MLRFIVVWEVRKAHWKDLRHGDETVAHNKATFWIG
jgi:hypothetical protein